MPIRQAMQLPLTLICRLLTLGGSDRSLSFAP
jgi:hypothetical protein